MSNAIAAPPAVLPQIERALDTLGKDGYSVTAHENASGELSIVFAFGASEQTFKFRKDAWHAPEAVQKKIIDDLNI